MRHVLAMGIAAAVAMLLACPVLAQMSATRPAVISVSRPGIPDAAERRLPGAVTGLEPASNGRLLVLHMPKLRKLAIFDVGKANITKYIECPAEEVLFAAGNEKLLMLDPAKGTLYRYSLKTFEKELANNLPVSGKVLGLGMGYASDERALLLCTEQPYLALLDVKSFRLTAIKATDEDDHYGRDTDERPIIRADAAGTVFAVSGFDAPQVVTVQGAEAKLRALESDRESMLVLPSADGRTLYGMQMLSADLEPIHKRRPPERPFYPGEEGFQVMVPAIGGQYYVCLSMQLSRREEKLVSRATLHADRDLRPLVALPKLPDLMGTDEDMYNWSKEMLGLLDRRLTFIPQAGLLAVLPASADRLILHPFDVMEALKKADLDYLFVDSMPVTAAELGQEYTYQVGVKSRKGGLTYDLQSAPEGMTISKDGKITWKVPKDVTDRRPVVILLITDSANQQVYHTFQIHIAQAK